MAAVMLLPMRDLPFFEMAIMLMKSIVLKGRAGRLWRPLCESGGLLVHPTLAIISAFKESNGLIAAGLGAEELASEIKKHIPEFVCSYKPDFRQAIADSWPKSIDDSAAREEWGWEPEYPFEKMVIEMLDGVSAKLGIPYK